MKRIILPFFCFFSSFAIGQAEQEITYKNSFDGFIFKYPSEWDSTTFSRLKEQFKVDFGATIKPNFNNNKTGGYFTLKKSNSFGADIAILSRETEASLKQVYPNAKIIESKQKLSKNNIPYHSLITQIEQFGSIRTTSTIQIIKGNALFTFSFICPKNGFDKLNLYFETVIESFKFIPQ